MATVTDSGSEIDARAYERDKNSWTMCTECGDLWQFYVGEAVTALDLQPGLVARLEISREKPCGPIHPGAQLAATAFGNTAHMVTFSCAIPAIPPNSASMLSTCTWVSQSMGTPVIGN